MSDFEKTKEQLIEELKQLRESGAGDRRLFETMRHGVVYQDGTGQILRANSAATRLLGLKFEQMLGRTSVDPRWQAIREDGSDFPGEDHPSMVALRTREPVSNVIMGIFPSGQINHGATSSHSWAETTRHHPRESQVVVVE